MVSSLQSSLGTERKVVTELPRPRSHAPCTSAARPWSAPASRSGFPVYIERGEGAILEDVDGNRLLDLGSGIAVTSIGHAVPEVVDAVSRAGRRLHPHLLHGRRPTRATSRSARSSRASPRATSPRPPRSSTPAPRPSRTPSRSRASPPVAQAIVVFDHAYHGRTNLTMALTAKNMPYKDRFGPFAPEVYRVAMSYPFRDGADRGRGGGAGDRPDRDPGRRPQRRRRSSSSRSRARAASSSRPTGSCRRCRSGRRRTASSSSPTRSRAASVAPATGSPSSTRASSPTSSRTAKGLAGGMPLAGVTGRAELMNAVHEGGLGGTYGGNPVAARGGAGHDQDPARPQPRGAGPRARRHHARRRCARSNRTSPSSATCAGAARWSPSSSSSPARKTPNAAAAKADRQLLQPAGRHRAELRHVRQRDPAAAAAGHHRRAAPRRARRAGRRGALSRLIGPGDTRALAPSGGDQGCDERST